MARRPTQHRPDPKQGQIPAALGQSASTINQSVQDRIARELEPPAWRKVDTNLARASEQDSEADLRAVKQRMELIRVRLRQDTAHQQILEQTGRLIRQTLDFARDRQWVPATNRHVQEGLFQVRQFLLLNKDGLLAAAEKLAKLRIFQEYFDNVDSILETAYINAREIFEPRGTLKDDADLDKAAGDLTQLTRDLRSLPVVERARVLSVLARSLDLAAVLSAPSESASAQKNAAKPAPDRGPEKPPRVWPGKGKSEGHTAITFLLSVYAEWLPDRLTLPRIRKIDPKLGTALTSWARKHQVPGELAAFFNARQRRSSEEVDRELQELKIVVPADAYKVLPDDKRRADRLFIAAQARSAKASRKKKARTRSLTK